VIPSIPSKPILGHPERMVAGAGRLSYPSGAAAAAAAGVEVFGLGAVEVPRRPCCRESKIIIVPTHDKRQSFDVTEYNPKIP